MNFFKSVFIDDDDDPNPSNPTPISHHPNPEEDHQQHEEYEDDEYEQDDDDGSGPDPSAQSSTWTFGGLMKTLQVKSEWIDTYRRDLEEFGSGLKRETEVLRKVVKDLPEISASKAQGPLESVGQAIDSIGSAVWKSTSEIIAHGKESLLALDNDDYVYNNNNIGNGSNNSLGSPSVVGGRYSRFEAQLRGIQCDVRTYIEEVEDVDDYDKWRSGFDLGEKREEMEDLMRENGGVGGVYKRVVPNDVSHEVFWERYYYRVHRLEKAEDVRARLVKRAISTEDDEEELSWDVDDDEEEVKKVDDGGSGVNASGPAPIEETKEASGDKVNAVESSNEGVSSKEAQPEVANVEEEDGLSKKSEEKVGSEGRREPSESGKESDISVVSTQPSTEDDDMGWDEIEDLGSGDEKKEARGGSPNREVLRKRLSAAEEDEDLSWDIEDDDDDDDEPVKA